MDVEELVLVEVVVGKLVLEEVVVGKIVVVEEDVVVVPGPRMVSMPGTPRTVIVSGPLCALMLAGVNVKTPLAFAVSVPTLISRISPCPFPMATPPRGLLKAIRAVPLEQSIGCSRCGALTRAWQPPVVQPEQSALDVHDVPPLEQSDVQAIAVDSTTLMAVGSTSIAHKLGSKFTLNASVERSGPL